MNPPDPLLDHPPGGMWRLTSRYTAESRRRRFDEFIAEMRPTAEASVLDVGVADTAWRSANFLEASYPWPDRITAVSLEPMPTFQAHFPEVRLVVADGRALPFPDQSFDIGFSNAVVEHVGDRGNQRRFIGELLRTSRRIFVATPNAWFPIDPHTLLPFVHWLPRRIRHPFLRLSGNGFWASEETLNPLSERAFRELFPARARVRILRQRTLGMASVLVAVAELEGDVA